MPGVEGAQQVHAATRSRSRPSAISTMRSATLATLGSCVIRTIVCPDLLRPRQDVEHLAARPGVEIAGGLVGQDHRGIGHQRAGDRDALLLAARELVGTVVHPVGETDLRERVAAPSACDRARSR